MLWWKLFVRDPPVINLLNYPTMINLAKGAVLIGNATTF